MSSKTKKVKTGSVQLDADEFEFHYERVRISIMVPGDVIRCFKEAAEAKHTKYQTLMNSALQSYADHFLVDDTTLAAKEALEVVSRKLRQIAKDLPTKKRAGR